MNVSTLLLKGCRRSMHFVAMALSFPLLIMDTMYLSPYSIALARGITKAIDMTLKAIGHRSPETIPQKALRMGEQMVSIMTHIMSARRK